MAELRPKMLVERIEVPKAPEILANSLREKILTGTYAEGAPLPNERDLAEMSGLSRTSVREALRILEAEGMITTRSGRNGGSVPRLPGQERLVRSIQLFVRSRRVRFGSLLEVRETLEPQLARLAALHRDAGDLEKLHAIQARMETSLDQIKEFTHMNVEWHMAVVQASHNELMIAFWQGIHTILHNAAEIDETYNSSSVTAAVSKAHRRILEAIVNRDADAAARRMARHMRAYMEHIQPRASPDTEL